MLVTVLAGLFASGFTITIMAVSLKDIANELGASETSLTWVVTGPFLALALTMPLFGKLGDVYGHRRVYLLGFAGFTVGALLTAFAWSGAALIAIRVLGSIPGAATGPTSMALIMRAFPDDDRVKAMGWWALVGSRRAGDRPGRGRADRRRDRVALDLRRAGPAVVDRAGRRRDRAARDARARRASRSTSRARRRSVSPPSPRCSR